MTVKKRYPLAPLAEALGLPNTSMLARHLGLSGTTWKEYRDQGVSEKVADRLACRAGFHPSEVWPDIVDEWIESSSAVCPECGDQFVPVRAGHRYCTPACRSRAANRRAYQNDPVAREKKLETKRRWYVECHAYALESERRRYRENREQIRARQNEQRRKKAAA